MTDPNITEQSITNEHHAIKFRHSQDVLDLIIKALKAKLALEWARGSFPLLNELMCKASGVDMQLDGDDLAENSDDSHVKTFDLSLLPAEIEFDGGKTVLKTADYQLFFEEIQELLEVPHYGFNPK